MFLSILFRVWWYEKYNLCKMEYELNLDGWLEEATLYSNELSDYNLNFDLLPPEKTNGIDGVTEINDLSWFNEKVDLPFPDDIRNVQFSETDVKELLSLISSNSDNSHLSSEIQNSSFYDLNFNFDLQGQVSSPGSSSDFTYSPEYEPISEASSPAQFAFSSESESISEANSPASFTSDSGAEFTLSSELGLSSEKVIPAYDADGSCKDSPPAVVVTVCDVVDTECDVSTKPLSIEEVFNSVRNREFVSTGKIPKVQVSLKESFHPYAKDSSRCGGDKSERKKAQNKEAAASRRRGDKSERKKVQNKEAAARYRIKKRIEEQELSGEVAGLEADQAKLKAQHDDLETEIKYLKKLMREMLQKKGIL